MYRISSHIGHEILGTMTCNYDHDNLMKKSKPLFFRKSGHGHSQWSWSNGPVSIDMHIYFEQLLSVFYQL